MLFTERAERQAAEAAERAVRAEPDPVIARVRALQEKQHELLRANPGMSSYELMLTSTNDTNRLDAAGRRFDDMMAGGGAYRFSPERPEE
jgi:hypothetical protein